jgi:molecular chaperone DnaK (HSP70)
MSKDSSRTTPRWLVGIDLGTSHTVVAAASLEQAVEPEIIGFQIPQLVGLGEVGSRPLLPSVQYQASSDEVRSADCFLPWETPSKQGSSSDLPIVGFLARQLGAKSPGRLVASAKSWLSHPSVDRNAPILPWGGVEGVEKISPVAASAGYLRHVRHAWNERHPQARLEDQDLTITVPASFDEAARALTCNAAREAGFLHFQ